MEQTKVINFENPYNYEKECNKLIMEGWIQTSNLIVIVTGEGIIKYIKEFQKSI